MPSLFVNYRAFCESSEQSSEEYGSWSEIWDFCVEGVSLTEKHDSRYPEEFTVDWTPVEGQEVYVLYVRYGDGDSFGSAEGKGEVVWVFRDHTVADAAKKALETADSDTYSVEIAVESGQKIKMNNRAYDYFTSINGYDIESFIVTK